MPVSPAVSSPQQNSWVAAERTATRARAAQASAPATPGATPTTAPRPHDGAASGPGAASDGAGPSQPSATSTPRPTAATLIPPTALMPAAALPASSAPPRHGHTAAAVPAHAAAAPATHAPAPKSRFQLLGNQFWKRLGARVGGAVGIWPDVSLFDYKGTTALITGATSPMGEACANGLLGRGVQTLLLADDDTHAIAQLIGRLTQGHPSLVAGHTTAKAVTTDLSKRGAGLALVAGLQKDKHHIDVLVHNASFADDGRFDLVDWVRHVDTVQVNYLSALELTRAALPDMRAARRGVILSVAAEGAFEAVPYAATYGSSKGGLVSFTESLFQEQHGTGVRVAVLCGPPPQPKGSWLQWRHAPAKPTGVTPAQAVTEALEGIDEGECYIIPKGVTLWKNQLLHELPGVLGTQLAQRLRPHVQAPAEPA